MPCLKIVDWPQFRYRGIQDDISRGPVPTLEFMKAQVRRCAELKLNMLSYYIENVVATRSHGGFAPAGGSISIGEWRELSDYARRYFVELVGNFQSFGHFKKILSYPQYSHLGEAYRLLSPAFNESYDFLQSVYAEMAPAFSSAFFNVNCDETWDLGRGASKKMVDSLGIAGVYARHLNRIHAGLKKLGKRMMMWGDIVLEYPEIMQHLPQETVVVAWHYSALDSFDFLITPVEQAGFDMMISPGVLNSNRLMPDYAMTFGNIKGFVETAARHKVMGVLTTVWDDGGSALFTRDWLGVAYAAERSWNANADCDWDFDQRFDRVVYGDRQNRVASTIWLLTKLTELSPTQEMNEKVFWSKVIPDRGEHLSLSLGEWEQVSAICDSAEQTLDRAAPMRHASELDYWRFTIAQYRHLARERAALLEAARSYRSACLQQSSTPARARREILRAMDSVNAVYQSLTHLEIQYRSLWLRENRVFWLNKISARYDERRQQLAEVASLLLAALRDFEMGHHLPPPNEVRLDIAEAQGQYFQSWLIAGPFPNPRDKGYEVDHLTELGGERKARGRVAGEFKAPDGKTYRWKKVTSPKLPEVDLAALFEENTRVLAYAYARITSLKEQTVRATFGSNDGIKVYCNGKLVFQRHVKRNLMPDEDEAYLTLTKGNNHLLLKIDQGKGGWGFSFRLPDNVIRNHDYKYRIVE